MHQFASAIDTTGGRRAGLEGAVRDAIRAGLLAAPSPMPSTRVLAAELGWSRATVVSAYEQLIAEGYLVARHGARTEVATLHQPSSRSTPSPLGPTYRYDFRPGEPNADAFPRAAWLRSVRRVVANAPAELFGYADPRGRHELRTALAGYLGRARSVAAGPDAVSVFGGFSSALGFLGEAFARRGVTRIAVEDPTLFIHRWVLGAVGLEVVPIPVDADGIDVDRLAEADVGAVVVTPAHQYPLGVVMSAPRRSELLAWAREREAWVIEDDYDGEFRYDRQPIGAMQGLDPSRVIYAGTASKSFAAGVRLSWLVVPDELQVDLLAVKQLRAGVSSIDQVAFADFVERGSLDRHLRTMRASYRRRQLDIAERLRSEVAWLDVPLVEAGLHLTCTFDGDEAAIVERAAERGVGLLGLGRHWAAGPSTPGLVIGFSRPANHAFANGLDQLIDTLADSAPAPRRA